MICQKMNIHNNFKYKILNCSQEKNIMSKIRNTKKLWGQNEFPTKGRYSYLNQNLTQTAGQLSRHLINPHSSSQTSDLPTIFFMQIPFLLLFIFFLN